MDHSNNGGMSNPFREVYKCAHFRGNDDSIVAAKQLVCSSMAMELFSHLIHVPKGKLVWRIMPEFDVTHDTIPADLSKRMDRKQIDKALGVSKGCISLDVAKKELGLGDWAPDYCTDSIFQVAAPIGEWRLFKSYMRYAVILDNEAIPPMRSAA